MTLHDPKSHQKLHFSFYLNRRLYVPYDIADAVIEIYSKNIDGSERVQLASGAPLGDPRSVAVDECGKHQVSYGGMHKY